MKRLHYYDIGPIHVRALLNLQHGFSVVKCHSAPAVFPVAVVCSFISCCSRRVIDLHDSYQEPLMNLSNIKVITHTGLKIIPIIYLFSKQAELVHTTIHLSHKQLHFETYLSVILFLQIYN